MHSENISANERDWSNAVSTVPFAIQNTLVLILLTLLTVHVTLK